MTRVMIWTVAVAMSVALLVSGGGVLEQWEGSNVSLALGSSAAVFGLAGALSARNGRGSRLALGVAWALALPAGLAAGSWINPIATFASFDFGYLFPWILGGAVIGLIGGLGELQWGQHDRFAVIAFTVSFAVAGVILLLTGYLVSVGFDAVGLDQLGGVPPFVLAGAIAGLIARGGPEWYLFHTT